MNLLFGASLNKLKNKRVDIKHKGSFPSPQDIDEAKYTAMNLFKDFCFKLYGLNYEDINLIDLLDDSRTKECLLGIDYEDKHVNIVADLALAFELLLKDFEESKRSPFGFSPYQFLKKIKYHQVIWGLLILNQSKIMWIGQMKI